MSRGLRLPVGVDGTGGTATVDRNAQALKIIRIALSDLDNNNAFNQNIGLGSDLIFDPSTPTFRATLRQRILDIFDQFEILLLFKLLENTIAFTKEKEGELILTFRFVNLESDEEVQFRDGFTGAGR